MSGDITSVTGSADVAVIWPAAGCTWEQWKHRAIAVLISGPDMRTAGGDNMCAASFEAIYNS